MTPTSAEPMTPALPAPPALETRDATIGYPQHVVFEHLDLALDPGSITTLIGPNGSGKSTILKAFGRLQPVQRGAVLLHGEPISSHSTRMIARELALLPQKPFTPSATTVRDLVSRGRHPHQSLFRLLTPADTAAIDEALSATGIDHLATRDVQELSGGQLQRAWIALVLAQHTPIVLLDEPTTFLDLNHQLDVLQLVRSMNRERNTTVLMVLHDLSLAARYSDRLVAVADGRVVADGAPWDVLTPTVLREAFSLDAQIIPDPVTGTPLVIPITKA